MVLAVRIACLAVVLAVAACDEGADAFHIHEPEDGFAVRYYDAVALPDGDVYAVGEQPYDERGVLLHFDGAAWTKLGFDFGFVTKTVWAAEPDRVWVGGVDLRSNDQVLGYWNGESFDDVYPGDLALDEVADIWGTSGDDVWVIATLDAPSLPHASVFHWDGVTWTESTELTSLWPPEPDTEEIRYRMAAGCSSAIDDVWMVGDWIESLAISDMESVSFHWNGSAWEYQRMCICCAVESIACDGNDVWATVRDCDGAGEQVFRFVDGAWREVYTSYGQDPEDSLGGVWVADGRAWVAGYTPTPSGNMPEPTSGMVLRFDGEQIDRLLPDVSNVGELSVVTVDGTGRVWGFGDLGAVVEIDP